MDFELLDGEDICHICNGTGEDKNGIFVCKKCRGQKKLDWVSKAVQLPPAKNPSALDRLNIRRLMHHIEETVDEYKFEPAEDVANILKGHLDTLVSRKAIYDYKVTCDESNFNNIDVYVKPVNTIEYVTMNVVINKEI